MNNVSVRIIKTHLLFWMLFIAYDLGVIYTFTGTFSSFYDYFVHYLLNFSLFYFNAHIVFNCSLGRKKRNYSLLIILVLTELLFYLLIKYGINAGFKLLDMPIARPITSIKLFVSESIWRAIYFIGLSVAYWFALSLIAKEKKISELETRELRSQLEKQVLENAYLQSQINPHFLFNTLTFLYTSANRFSEKLAESIVLLADLMRYSLKGAGPDGKTSLEDEIENVQNFIQLNQARFNNQLQLDFRVQGDAAKLRIIPLALLTYTENVFKYADLKDPAEPARIYLDIYEKELNLNISNKIKPSGSGHSHGIGMENINKRLDIYYKDQYVLNVSRKEKYYQLNLVMNL